MLFARFDQRSEKESYQQEPEANTRLPGQAFDQGVTADGRSGQRAKAVEMSPRGLFSCSTYLRISGAWLALSASDFFS
jgi:hypothetical protein